VSVVLALLRLVVYAFFILLIARFVIDWIRVFAREWRPSGLVLVIAETVYTVTDPPLRALRRVIPPLTMGGIRIDFAFLVLFLLCSILLGVLS
jgi:YggT family protein